MKTKHILAAICAVVIACTFSCKKYEEGPALSLRTKKARVANEWKYDQVIEPNGTNVTASYANNSIEFTKDGEYIATFGSSSAQTGTWQFAGDKEDIVLTPNDNSDATLITIVRLKNKQFWFNIEESNGIFEYRMSPK